MQLRSDEGTSIRFAVDGKRVVGTHRAKADSAERAVDFLLPRAGFVAGAVDLVPQAVAGGLRRGLMLRIPVWHPPGEQIEDQTWVVRRRTPVTFEGRQVRGWELPHHRTGGQLLGTVWLIDEPPYMVQWDFAGEGGTATRLIGERVQR